MSENKIWGLWCPERTYEYGNGIDTYRNMNIVA